PEPVTPPEPVEILSRLPPTSFAVMEPDPAEILTSSPFAPRTSTPPEPVAATRFPFVSLTVTRPDEALRRRSALTCCAPSSPTPMYTATSLPDGTRILRSAHASVPLPPPLIRMRWPPHQWSSRSSRSSRSLPPHVPSLLTRKSELDQRPRSGYTMSS